MLSLIVLAEFTSSILLHVYLVGALAFDAEYARWVEEQNRMINELRSAVNSHASDTELHTVVESVAAHSNDIFRLKGVAAKSDVFHILSGMWKTPAERCFMWIGGFRPSELLKVRIICVDFFLAIGMIISNNNTPRLYCLTSKH